MGEMASSAGNWLTGTTAGNLTMGAGGLFLASRLFGGGGGGGGIGGMLNKVGGIAAVGAAIAPIFMAENGMGRAMEGFQNVFRGIAEGSMRGDWSQMHRGFGQLGGVYSEGFGNIGDRLGLGGDNSPSAGPAGAALAAAGVTRVGRDAPAALTETGLGMDSPAAGAGDLAAGEQIIAGVEGAEAQAAERRASIGQMRREARHGG